LSAQPPAQRPRGAVSRVLGTGIGFFLAAAILMESIFLFRADDPILWSPPPDITSTVAYGVLGTLFAAALIGVVWLATCVVAVLGGRRPLSWLGNGLLQVLIMAAITGGGLVISLRAFYWPWAVASALYTVENEPERWRLPACRDLLVDRWGEDVKTALEKIAHGSSPSQRLAAQWIMASTGDKAALAAMLVSARELPAAQAGSPETPGCTRADALWLLNAIVEGDWADLGALEASAGARLARLKWDGQSGRYRLDLSR